MDKPSTYGKKVKTAFLRKENESVKNIIFIVPLKRVIFLISLKKRESLQQDALLMCK